MGVNLDRAGHRRLPHAQKKFPSGGCKHVNSAKGNLSIAMPVSRGYIYSAGVFGHMTYECVHLDTDGNMFCSLVDAGEFLDVTAAFGYVGDMRSQVMVADVSTLPTNYG